MGQRTDDLWRSVVVLLHVLGARREYRLGGGDAAGREELLDGGREVGDGRDAGHRRRRRLQLHVGQDDVLLQHATETEEGRVEGKTEGWGEGETEEGTRSVTAGTPVTAAVAVSSCTLDRMTSFSSTPLRCS